MNDLSSRQTELQGDLRTVDLMVVNESVLQSAQSFSATLGKAQDAAPHRIRRTKASTVDHLEQTIPVLECASLGVFFLLLFAGI